MFKLFLFLEISPTGVYLVGASVFFLVLFILFVLFYLKVRDKQNKMILKQQNEKSLFQDTLLRTQLEIQELVSKAIRDLRDLSRSLNTDSIASMGLVRAIELELELFRKSGFQTTLYTEGEIRKMEPQQELILFRIVQESLNNIIKHAEAKTIRVTALYTADELDLQVEDDGKGADPSQLDMDGNSYKSLGLRNMSNRAGMIGGTFSINSVPGNGTIIKLNIPFNKI